MLVFNELNQHQGMKMIRIYTSHAHNITWYKPDKINYKLQNSQMSCIQNHRAIGQEKLA